MWQQVQGWLPAQARARAWRRRRHKDQTLCSRPLSLPAQGQPCGQQTPCAAQPRCCRWRQRQRQQHQPPRQWQEQQGRGPVQALAWRPPEQALTAHAAPASVSLAQVAVQVPQLAWACLARAAGRWQVPSEQGLQQPGQLHRPPGA